MNAYIVTLLNLTESVDMANRCVKSANTLNISAEIFPAIYKDIAINEMETENLKLSKFDQSYSNVGSVIGNFVTQYRIWKKITESNESGIVLEHDAIFTAPLPDLTNKGDIINIGKPSYGKFQTKSKAGIYPMFSKTGGYIPGAHGYYLTPKGAQQLVSFAQKNGVAPCDLFLNNKNFPDIKEIYPWVVEAKDEFTTIQKEKGCIAKHNYDKNYKII